MTSPDEWIVLDLLNVYCGLAPYRLINLAADHGVTLDRLKDALSTLTISDEITRTSLGTYYAI